MAAWPIKRSWTPGDVANVVANPFYAINIDEGLALPHEPLISEDDWVRADVGLIEELGPEPTCSTYCRSSKATTPQLIAVGASHSAEPALLISSPETDRSSRALASNAPPRPARLDEPAPLLFPAMSTSNRPAAGHRPVLVPVGQDPVPRLPCPIATRALAAPVALMLADHVSPAVGLPPALAGPRRSGCSARWSWVPMSAAPRRTWRVSSSWVPANQADRRPSRDDRTNWSVRPALGHVRGQRRDDAEDKQPAGPRGYREPVPRRVEV